MSQPADLLQITQANSLYVILDPGHGGNDPGAPPTSVAQRCGVPLDIKEKDRTLHIARRVRDILLANGVRVGMTRISDTNPSLSDRTNYVNRERPNLVVSIHANSAESCGDGVEAFYSSIGPGWRSNPHTEASRQLAQRLALKINQMFNLRLRRNNGIEDSRGNLHMVREPTVPSALIEMAFISNRTEALLLRDRPDDFAQAIAQAILEQLGIRSSYNRLLARHSGRCMDVSGASRSSGAAVMQWDCHGRDNQLWSFVPAGNNYYRLVAKHSGKCLDVYGASRDNGARLIQWDCHGGDNQLFRREQFGSHHRLRAKHSNRCVDVSGARRDNGVRLIQWDCHSGDNQLWAIQSRDMAVHDEVGGIFLEPLTDEYVSPMADVAIPSIIEHIVAEGDSLELMAEVYEIPVSVIREANPELTDTIQPGMVLRIPVLVPHHKIEMPPSDTNQLYLPVVVR